MGADMTLWIIPHFKMNSERYQQLLKIAEKNEDEDLEEAINEYKNFDSSRDVCGFYLEDISYLATGGLSWGDFPTDAAELFNSLCECDQFWDMAIKWVKEDRNK